MDKICRLCSEAFSQLTSIFSFHRDRLLSDMITLICPIKIDPADELPKNICSDCLRLILDAVQLREKSVRCDLKFRSEIFPVEARKVDEIRSSDSLYSPQFFGCDPSAVQNKKEPFVVGNLEKNRLDPHDQSLKSQSNHRKHNSIESEPKKKERPKEAPANCPICRKYFSRRWNMMRHMQKCHPELIVENKKRRLNDSTDGHNIVIKVEAEEYEFNCDYSQSVNSDEEDQ